MTTGNTDAPYREWSNPEEHAYAGPLINQLYGRGEDPVVEIKQTVTTEYRIKANGTLYSGTISEVNVWGSLAQRSNQN